MRIKSIHMILAMAMMPFAGFSQGGAFQVTGKVNPKHNGRFLKLYYNNGATKIADSVAINKGSFTLKGELSEPVLAKLSLDTEKAGDQLELFLAAGNIRMEARDSIRRASVKGPKLTEDYERLAMQLRPIDYITHDRFAKLQGMPEGTEKKQFLQQLLDGLDEYGAARKKVIRQFVLDNPSSYVSLYYLDHSSLGVLLNYEATFPYYDKLSKELKETPLGKKMQQRLLGLRGMMGQSFKDFVSTTPEGGQLSLKEVIGKNKYTLLDFWASWCGPCRKENPYVVKTFNSFKEKGFTVLSVSLDDKADKWKEAIEKDGMPWFHVSSLQGWKEPAASLYGVRAIPQNMLIDDKGKIVAVNLRGETLYDKIEGLLN